MNNDLFTLSTGESVEQTDSFEVGGFQEIIPEGTKLLCAIASAKWESASQYSNDHIVLMLHVVERGPYRDYTVNHKLHVNDAKDKKRDAAKRMLGAYDTLTGGKLSKAFRSGQQITDQILGRCLCGGEVVATFDVWESDDKTKSGNWVRAVGPKPKALQEQDAKTLMQAEDYDDDIAF